MKDGGRLLVVQTAFLGDVVLTTPLFRALKRVCPDGHLTALVTPAASPLLEGDPHLDDLWTYDKKGGESLLAMARRVRAGRFDGLVCAHRSHRTALLALLSGIPERIGFRDAGFSRAYGRRVERPLPAHEVDRNLALLRGVGAEPLPEDRVLAVEYSPAEAAAVRELVAGAGFSPEDRLAGLCPGSVWPTKRWPAEGFARVAGGLVERGWRVVLLGGPGDGAVAAEVEALVARHGHAPSVLNVAGRTPLKALAAWMDRLGLLVTNDSAPLHVAAARGTPTVAVFGATTPSLGFGPFHAASRVVEVTLPCRPCGLHGGEKCPLGHFRCMGEVRPEAVLAACLELVEGSPSSPARLPAHAPTPHPSRLTGCVQ